MALPRLYIRPGDEVFAVLDGRSSTYRPIAATVGSFPDGASGVLSCSRREVRRDRSRRGREGELASRWNLLAQLRFAC